LSAFSKDGNDFLLCTSDNRIALWDIQKSKRRHLYVEKKHLAHSYTCLAWHRDADLGSLAVGCSDGTVVLWDLTRGVVARVIGDNASSSGSTNVPSDVVFSADGKSVFVASITASDVNEYSVKTGVLVKAWTGHKKGTNRLAYNPKAPVVALGSSSVKLIDTSADAKKKKFDGHFAGGLSAITFSDCGRYLACAGVGNREVLLFDVKAGASTDAMLVLPTRHAVHRMVVRVSNNVVNIMCTYEQGAGGCLLRAVDGEKVHTMQVEATAVLGASFSPSGNVLIALGASTQPRLCTLDITSETDLPTSVTLPNDKNAPNTDTSMVASELALPKVLGPNEFGGSKRPSVEDTLNPSKRTRNEDDVGANVTMEERLAGLASQLHQLENPAASAENAAPAPTSDSLVTLVDQALQTGDDALLEQCFGCEDADVVEETSRRLPTGRIVLLLRRLVSKFEKRPSRGLLLTRWLAALLRHHTAYLVSVPDLTARLAGLSQMLEQRLSSYSRLASLGGRLDLLLSRVSTVGSHQMVQEPLVVVRE